MRLFKFLFLALFLGVAIFFIDDPGDRAPVDETQIEYAINYDGDVGGLLVTAPVPITQELIVYNASLTSINQEEPPAEEPVNMVLVIIASVIAVLEVILRMIPNDKITGPIGLIVNILKLVSDALNRSGSTSKTY